MIAIKENHRYAIFVLSLSTLLLIYYSLWVLALPFVDKVYLPYISWFFPAIHLAFVIPVGIGCCVSLLLFLRAFYLVRADRIQERSMDSKKIK